MGWFCAIISFGAAIWLAFSETKEVKRQIKEEGGVDDWFESFGIIFILAGFLVLLGLMLIASTKGY